MKMKVSICIPTYNQVQYLEQAIRSAYNQTLTPFEIIISDDCSSDGTPDLLARLSQEISILKYVRQNRNLGIAGNTDQCLRLASGEYIVRLDSDDYLSANYVEKMAKLLMKYPSAGYAHADVQEVDQNDNYLRKRTIARKTGFQDSQGALLAASKGYRVAANIIMFRKSALHKVNFITHRPDYVEDYHLSASLASADFGNVYSNQILSFYRVWVDAGKARQRRKLMEIEGLYRVFSEVLEPAFKERGWPLNKLNREKANFARKQSDCLGWDVYSIDEKKELKTALAKLSTSPSARLYGWVYLNGHGHFLKIFEGLCSYPKSLAKNLLIAYRAKNIS